MNTFPYRGEDVECAAVSQATMVAPNIHSLPEDNIGIYSTSEEEFSHSEGGGTNNSVSTSLLVGTFYNPQTDSSDTNSFVSSLQDELNSRDAPESNSTSNSNPGSLPTPRASNVRPVLGDASLDVPSWKDETTPEQALGLEPSPRRRLWFWAFVVALCMLIGIAVAMGIVIGMNHEQNKRASRGVSPPTAIASSDQTNLLLDPRNSGISGTSAIVEDSEDESSELSNATSADTSSEESTSTETPTAAPVTINTEVPSATATVRPTMLQIFEISPITTTQWINEFVSSLPGYTRQALEIPTSPQKRALNWITTDPNLTSYSREQLLQRFVLKTFYFATNELNDEHHDTEEQWIDMEGWQSSSYTLHECQWHTTHQDNSIEPPCDDVGVYTALALRRNNLHGSIPPELALLSSLAILDLELNSIQSKLPTELGLLTHLERLILRGNDLTGPIPSQIGALTNLTHLELENNALNQSIPTELSQLEQLQSLTLDDNQLQGPLPSQLGELTLLNELLLHGNQITGAVPTEIGSWTELQSLSLRNNMLSGTFPTEIGLLTNLERLWAFQNDLVGNLPSELGLATALTLLSFSRNEMVGSLPTELGRLTRLKNMWLYQNLFTGPIPSELGLLAELELFPIRDNDITGAVPEEVCAIPNVVVTIDCLEVACNCDCTCALDEEATDDGK